MSMALPVGSRLGPYEISALLGVGGMGEVYRARDTRLGRTVALKVLPSEATADPERRQSFEEEARTVAALNHPNICVLYDIGESVPRPEPRRRGVPEQPESGESRAPIPCTTSSWSTSTASRSPSGSCKARSRSSRRSTSPSR